MSKFKYQGTITKIITTKKGEINKALFISHLFSNIDLLNNTIDIKPININVVSFSSGKDFPDQILSILSFLRYAGIPTCWTLYSDGSHSVKQIELIETKLKFVKIAQINLTNASDLYLNIKRALIPYKDHLLDYALKKPLGKKLFYYLNHEIEKSTLFLDADVIFYKKAYKINHLANNTAGGWFLPDAEWGCLDSRYMQEVNEQMYQVNSGFFFLQENISNVEEGLNFLKKLNFEYEYFTEQTVFHIVFRSNNFYPLDPRIFVLNSSDQFDLSYLYNREDIAIRHYTGPVRHKMWQKDWRWHLSLS